MAKVVLNHKGMAQLLKDPGVRAELTKRMQRVQQQAGPGARIEQVTHDRAVVRVVSGTMRHEADTGDLARALRAAGGD